MMRHSKRVRVVSLKRAARVAATALLAAVAVAATASPVLADTTHRRPAHAAAELSTTGLVSVRHVILQAAMGGAAIMLLLTIGLLFLGRMSKAAGGPKPQLVPLAGPEKDARSSDTTSDPSRLAETIELGDHSSASPDLSVDDDHHAATDYSAASTGLAAPSWLGLVAPPTDVDLASQVSQPTAVDPASSGGDEAPWPDFLALANDADQASDVDQASKPSYTLEPPEAPEISEPIAEPVGATQLAEPDDYESPLPLAALRVLGAGPPQPGDDDMPMQRHQVTLGDDQIEVVLARAPRPDQAALPGAGSTRLAATPYVRWAPLPYDIPDDGLAFACVGAGDEGCLFVDLAAAPGAVAITGDTDSAIRLAESIVHQLCSRAAEDQAISVHLVGSSIPKPHPASAISVQTLRELATASLDIPPDRTDIVFCELRSNDDAFALARHVTSSRHRIIPVVLGHLPGAVWSFTASLIPLLDGALQLDSDVTGSPSFSW